MFSAGFFLSVMAAAMFPLRSVEGFPLSCFTITVADAVLIRVLIIPAASRLGCKGAY